MRRSDNINKSLEGPEGESPLFSEDNMLNENALASVHILLAVESGNSQEVVKFLNQGANPDAVDDSGKTLLHLAVIHGHFDIYKTLFVLASNIDAVDYDGHTCLFYAWKHQRQQILSDLASRRASFSAQDVNKKDNFGWSVLHYVARDHHTALLKAVIRGKGDLNVTTERECYTALRLAAWNGHVDMVNLLLEQHVKVNTLDHDNHTPLYHAYTNGHKKVIELLEAKDGVIYDNALENQKFRIMKAAGIKNKGNNPALNQVLLSIGCQQTFIDALHREDDISRHHLKKLFSTAVTIEELALGVKKFLLKRWAYIKSSDAPVTSIPISPMNLVTATLGAQFLKPGESLAKLLMNTLNEDDYLMGESLKELTETEKQPPSLLASRFAVNDAGNAVIPFEPWINMQIMHADAHLIQYQTGVTPFNERETQMVQNIAPPYSMLFLDEFALRKKLMAVEDGSLATHVMRLCDDLMAHGKTSKKGTDDEAHEGVTEKIKQFRIVWDSLNPADRDSVSKLKQKGFELNFGHYLSVISEKGGGEHDDETCVEVNSKCIKDILNEHLDVFKSIIVNPKNQDPTATNQNKETTSFTWIIEQINAKIAEREKAISVAKANPSDKKALEGAIHFYHGDQKNGEERLVMLRAEYEKCLETDELTNIKIDHLTRFDFYKTILPKEKFDQCFNALPLDGKEKLLTTAVVQSKFGLVEYMLSFPALHQLGMSLAVNDNKQYMMDCLLKNKVNVNLVIFREDEPHTAVYFAVKNGFINIAHQLFTAGAQPIDEDFTKNDLNSPTLLHYGAEFNKKSLVERSLTLSKKPDRRGKKNVTALMLAAKNGNDEILGVLIANGADCTRKDTSNRTALFYAAENNSHGAVAVLAPKAPLMGAEKCKVGYTPLHIAAKKGFEEVVSALIDFPQDFDNVVMINKENMHTPLIDATENNHIDIVSLLIKKNVKLNVEKNKNETALVIAVQKGYVEIAKMLLKAGAHKNKFKPTLLWVAASQGNEEMVEALVEGGSTKIDDTQKTPIFAAIDNGHDGIAGDLITYRIMPSTSDLASKEMYYYCARYNRMELYRDFKYHSFNEINERYRDGQTALHTAVQYNNIQAVRKLVSFGANVNATNSAGNTPLFAALRDKKLNIAFYLVNNNATLSAPEIVALEQLCIIHTLVFSNRLDIFNTGCLRAVDVNQQSENGETALHKAAASGHWMFVMALLSRDADVSLQDKNNKTAYDLALANGYPDIANLLHMSLQRSLPRATVAPMLVLMPQQTGQKREQTEGAVPDPKKHKKNQ